MNFHLFKSWYIGTIGIGAIGIEIGIGAIGIEIGAIGTSDLDDGLNRIVSNEKGKLSVPKAIRETELYDLDTEKYMTLEEWWKVQLHEHNENWVGFWYLWIIEIWNLIRIYHISFICTHCYFQIGLRILVENYSHLKLIEGKMDKESCSHRNENVSPWVNCKL